MTSNLPEINGEQRAVLERIGEIFRLKGIWPTFGDLDGEFDRKDIDLFEVLKSIPVTYVRFDRFQRSYPQRGMLLELNVFGFSISKDSENDLALFFEVIQWLASIESDFSFSPQDSPTSVPTATDRMLSEYLASKGREISPIILRKLGLLIQNEPPGVREGFSVSDGSWTITIARGIRDYRSVNNLEEYASVIRTKAPELFGLKPPVEMIDLVEQINSWSLIPGVVPKITNEVVLRAMMDAENLIQSSGPTSAVDRVHTILHGYLRAVCATEGIVYSQSESMVVLLRKIRNSHTKLADLGFRSQDINKVLNSCANILDALLPVRNQASVAHANDVLIGESEARLVINVGRTLLDYLNCKLS